MSRQAIICVDDERTILDALKAQLKKEFAGKYDIHIAESAAEARELIEELQEEGDSIRAVISDAIMPEESGSEFLIDLHAKEPGIIKILLTGQVTESAVGQAEEAGALNGRLSKPWQEAELVKLITGTEI